MPATSSATCSARAGAAVSPGDSIAINRTSRATSKAKCASLRRSADLVRHDAKVLALAGEVDGRERIPSRGVDGDPSYTKGVYRSANNPGLSRKPGLHE